MEMYVAPSELSIRGTEECGSAQTRRVNEFRVRASLGGGCGPPNGRAPANGETGRAVYEWTGCGCFFAYSLKNS